MKGSPLAPARSLVIEGMRCQMERTMSKNRWTDFLRTWAAAIILSMMPGWACTPVHTTSAGAVGVDREQGMLVSSAEVNQSAEKAYAQTIQEARA